MKKNILVTGASSGFGLLLAKELHKRGYNVIGTSRNPDKNQASLPFKMLALDITDDKSIKSFGKQLFTEIKQLDVLINNAGFYLSGLAEETTITQGKQQFETNFWGTVMLTNELLPYFRNQRFGKIVTVGSIMGLISLPGAAYYAASKHALEGYFKALRFELNKFNIKVSMVEPMWSKTNIVTNSKVAENKISDYDEYRTTLEDYTKDLFSKSEEPTAVVETLLKLVENESPKFNNPVGKGSSLFPAIQYFSFKTFENSIIKNINKFKK
ncbi:3-oxoacyl-(acyl-carrier-protein) reductase FabG [Mariniflexile rhizosphaerae]|uniref:SDR family NAD(P)-dependent oxidoreductase n=1 Tax=unclassified Mariniflexile TaxID=2643887 RepID=UPI000CBCE253|nr:SDR family NAD(P)-dependent oxidoreductase [Mariniflexile sp. TRM1-10]AXP81598.1 3-oxoacyl-(acyl-carrier-protein) reductase FabG [Mariniflexile sp. TRM1-10]PLB17583.1 MAG: Short-chain dehydrogenase/reductase SDR [Flavobacteriaceae bacterium FS1-H7996/R]